MLKLNDILWFCLKAFLIYGGMYFLFSQTGMEDNIIQVFRNISTNTYDSGTQTAIFQPNSDYSDWDTKLLVYRNDINPYGEFQYYSVKYLGYISLLVFISLVLASPVSWFRRCIGLLVGTVLMFIYVNLMTGVLVRTLVYKIKDKHDVLYSGWGKTINDGLHDIFIENGFEWMGLLPIIFWLITTIRLSDLGLGLPDVKATVAQPESDKSKSPKTKKKKKGKK